MTVSIETLSLGSMDNFIHIIVDNDSGEAMVVDAAWDAEAILAHCQARQLTLTGLLLTHSHADHTSAITQILQAYNIPAYISREEFRIGLARLKKPHFIADGDRITLGKSEIQVIATPGHTIGSVCYLADNQLVAGDTLFVDGCGRCNFIESDVNKMFQSLQRLKQLPDDTVIYCGHDYGQQKTDTLGNQKRTNPYLLIEDKDFFVEFRMNLQSQYRSIPFAASSADEMQRIYEQHMT